MNQAATTVRIEVDGPVLIVTIDRPEVRNAVDGATAQQLANAFRAFDGDDALAIAVLTGAGDTFCSGADLGAVARPDEGRALRLELDGDGPMGPTRLVLGKPVIAAVEGFAVAGGLELALWCDLRVAASDATFGVYCRRFGIPLIDGGTVRLPRLVGESHALDMILTGRGVGCHEAHAMGLANRVVEPGTARDAAVALAHDLAALPQVCLRSDRASLQEQAGLPLDAALRVEFEHGMATLATGAFVGGAQRFVAGAGRHGTDA